ncbi:hypothetical protein [Aequorivita viscosa]|uniref:Uncharacterized protein n=1 Tax=Aequorivita viscosa TaxID=797419 RepID=A0A1M6LKJ1_9FLAO|nr:hypothetical protein [Aequorivita viscosa]SDV99410.1 hypothetical protein SAMN05216556_1019 [Aequorivita viscosa]SHJ71727.1 hypothetical protein SAMN04487908_12363 [Aequorivita viscosa]
MQSDEENREDSFPQKRSLPSRVVIYPKDIQQLTGKSYRYALELNKEIRKYFRKKKHHLLTIYEFADYTGINPEIIITHLK